MLNRLKLEKMRSLYSMLIFIMVCMTLMPKYVLLSRDFRSQQSRNVTDSDHRPTERNSSKHAQKHKRPVVHVKERGPVTQLTRRPTNFKRVRLFGRVGLFLHVNANGTVSGSLNQHSTDVIFELQSFGPSIVQIRHVETGKFLAMDSRGTLQTRNNATDECLFYENHEENSFVSFASFKYYMKEHHDIFISVKRNGEIKQGTSTLPGQESMQFIPLIVNNWRLTKDDRL